MAYEIEYNGNIIEAPDEASAQQILAHIASTQSSQMAPRAEEPSFFDKAGAALQGLQQQTQAYAPYTAVAGIAGPFIKDYVSGPQVEPTIEQNKDASPLTAAILSGFNSASFNKFPEIYGLSQKLLGGDYETSKNAERARIDELTRMYPGSSLLSSIAGFLAGAPGKVVKGATAILPKTTGFVGGATVNALINNALGQASLPLDATSRERLAQAGMDTLLSGATDTLIGALGKARQIQQIKNELQQGGTNAVDVPYSKNVIPQVVEARSALSKDVPDVGTPPLTAAEMTNAGNLDAVQNTISNSPFTFNDIRKIGIAEQEYQSQIGNTLEKRMGIIPDAGANPLGLPSKNVMASQINIEPSVENLNKIYSDKVLASKERFNKVYGDIQAQLKQTQSQKFVAQNTYDVGKELSAIVSEGAGGVATPSLKRILKEANALQTVENVKQVKINDPLLGERVVGTQTVQEPAQVSLRDLHKLRQDISDVMYKSANKSEQTLLGKLLDAADRDIDTFGNQVSLQNPKLGSQILATNKAYSAEKNALKSDVLESIQKHLDTANGSTYELGRATDTLSKAIRDGRIDQLQKIEMIVGPEAMEPIKQAQMQKILRGNKVDDFDFIGGTPGQPQKNPFFKRVNAMNEKTLNYLFGEQNTRVLKNLAQIVPYMESAKIASEPAKGWFYKLMNIGGPAAYGAMAAVGGKPIVLATLLGTAGLNKLVSKWYSSPAITELLIRNNRPITSPQMARFMANQLSAKLIELEAKEAGAQENKKRISE